MEARAIMNDEPYLPKGLDHLQITQKNREAGFYSLIIQ